MSDDHEYKDEQTWKRHKKLRKVWIDKESRRAKLISRQSAHVYKDACPKCGKTFVVLRSHETNQIVGGGHCSCVLRMTLREDKEEKTVHGRCTHNAQEPKLIHRTRFCVTKRKTSEHLGDDEWVAVCRSCHQVIGFGKSANGLLLSIARTYLHGK